jgi:hypothetical protein
LGTADRQDNRQYETNSEEIGNGSSHENA